MSQEAITIGPLMSSRPDSGTVSGYLLAQVPGKSSSFSNEAKRKRPRLPQTRPSKHKSTICHFAPFYNTMDKHHL